MPSRERASWTKKRRYHNRVSLICVTLSSCFRRLFSYKQTKVPGPWSSLWRNAFSPNVCRQQPATFAEKKLNLTNVNINYKLFNTLCLIGHNGREWGRSSVEQGFESFRQELLVSLVEFSAIKVLSVFLLFTLPNIWQFKSLGFNQSRFLKTIKLVDRRILKLKGLRNVRSGASKADLQITAEQRGKNM